MNTETKNRVDQWLSGGYDEDTKQAIQDLQKNSPDELNESFYKELEFGTGGLRGIMGVGTNRMNKYTIGAATQGLSNYLLKTFPGKKLSAAVAYDSRNNSKFFAETTAKIFAANGIKAYLFEELRPTPELSFAIRELGCDTGVVITASHNPKEYNGYKAYWNDGAQVIPPHDKAIINEVKAVQVEQIKFEGNDHLIELIGKSIDDKYLDVLVSHSIHPDIIKAQKDLKIVFTSIHGTGITLVPPLLERLGFTNLSLVDEQSEPDGNFSTVIYPNPEEAEALSMAVMKSKEIDADILLGTDPDSDRVGIAIKDLNGSWQLLNGNQTACLLFNYIVEQRKAKGLAKPTDYVCKTIVTSDLIDVFSKENGLPCYNVLTGFKYIAEIIREKEGTETFICGGEESYGYLIGDEVRDKDAIAAVGMICEMAAFAKSQGVSLMEQLVQIYVKYGFFKEKLISITKQGMTGAEEIAKMMSDLRSSPPETINNSTVVWMRDYANSTQKNFPSGETESIDFPESNVLQFKLADGTKISARPSGTEPKIKFYFSVNDKLESADQFNQVDKLLDDRVSAVIADLNLG